jgi:integral membrane protein (TIGR01906 family)
MAAAAFFVLCFPLLLLSTTLRFEVGSMRLYEYGFDRYHATEVTGLDKSELKKAARSLIDYFNNSKESPQIQVMEGGEETYLFSQREINHLKDVKGLIRLFYAIQWITLAYILIYITAGFVMERKVFWQRLTKVLFFGSIFTLGLFAFFGIWAAIDFNGLFLTFHQASFSNHLWQLDSEDALIMMFPEGFFMDAALFLIGSTLAEAIILGGGAWIYRRRQHWKTCEVPVERGWFNLKW